MHGPVGFHAQCTTRAVANSSGRRRRAAARRASARDRWLPIPASWWTAPCPAPSPVPATHPNHPARREAWGRHGHDRRRHHGATAAHMAGTTPQPSASRAFIKAHHHPGRPQMVQRDDPGRVVDPKRPVPTRRGPPRVASAAAPPAAGKAGDRPACPPRGSCHEGAPEEQARHPQTGRPAGPHERQACQAGPLRRHHRPGGTPPTVGRR